MVMQFVISLGFIYFCPNTIFAHWLYLIGTLAVVAVAYILFMKKSTIICMKTISHR